MEKIKTFIWNNKWMILLYLFMFISLVYTSLNTFIASDDLPYSFYYRGEDRVTTIRQIINNQESDYLMINGRFFVHCMVQLLLIFGKTAWSILNPLVILLSLGFIYLIINQFTNVSKKNKIFLLMLISSLYLLLINIKYINYWVAGSVNYTWVTCIIIGVIYYYIKTNFDKYLIFNIIIFAILATAHEISLVFAISFLILMIILDFYNNKKINYKKLIYFIPIIIGGVFLLKAPGNALRMQEYAWWYEMSIVQRLLTSIPELSFNLFNIKNIYNVIPIIYIVNLLITNKSKKILNISMICLAISAIIFKSGWIYLVIAILGITMDLINQYKEKKYKLMVITIACYATAYAMILTPLFNSVRTNYTLYLYFIIRISMIQIKLLENSKLYKKFITVIILVLFCITMGLEIYAYTHIGNIYRDRIKAIEDAKANNLDTVYLKKIEKPFSMLHPESNEPEGSEYWAYRYFLQYYGLNEEIKIIVQ